MYILFVFLGWPSYLKCDNTSVFTPKNYSENECKNSPRKPLKFQSGVCLEPYLKPTLEPLAFYNDISGCGVSCQDPSFKSTELIQMKGIKKVFCWIFLAIHIFCAFPLWYRWRNSKKDTQSNQRNINLIFFIMTVLSTLHMIGFMVDFFTDDVVCRSDGTRRISEPKTEENYTCLFVFILVYFSENAWNCYFVILLYWLILVQSSQSAKEQINQRKKKFHVGVL